MSDQKPSRFTVYSIAYEPVSVYQKDGTVTLLVGDEERFVPLTPGIAVELAKAIGQAAAAADAS